MRVTKAVITLYSQLKPLYLLITRTVIGYPKRYDFLSVLHYGGSVLLRRVLEPFKVENLNLPIEVRRIFLIELVFPNPEDDSIQGLDLSRLEVLDTENCQNLHYLFRQLIVNKTSLCMKEVRCRIMRQEPFSRGTQGNIQDFLTAFQRLKVLEIASTMDWSLELQIILQHHPEITSCILDIGTADTPIASRCTIRRCYGKLQTLGVLFKQASEQGRFTRAFHKS